MSHEMIHSEKPVFHLIIENRFQIQLVHLISVAYVALSLRTKSSLVVKAKAKAKVTNPKLEESPGGEA